MSEFLEGDFLLDLDDILDPEQTGSEEQNTLADEDVETSTAPNEKAKGKTTIVKEEDKDDMSFDFDDEEDNTEDEAAKENINEEGNNTTESTLDGSSSTISAFASALFEQGAFPDLDEEEIKKVKSPLDLIELNKKQIEINELRDLNDIQKEALKAFRAGIDPAEFAKIKSEEIRYDSITEDQLTNEDVAKSVLTEYLKLNNTPDDIAADLIESYTIDEKLTSKAKEAIPKIKSILKENQKNREALINKEREDTINTIKGTLKETKEIINGIEITEKEKQELFNQMTKPAKILDDGTQLDVVMVKRQEDPVGFMLKLHYYAKLGLFDRKVESDLLSRKGKTNALKDFETRLNQGNSATKVRGGSAATKDDDLYDFDEIPDIKFK